MSTLKANLDMLKLIQLVLTFTDASGGLLTCGIGCGYVWQFNFKEFDLASDVYASDATELLKSSYKEHNLQQLLCAS
jgi:CCR4-NOT transcription complex subunit 7/8